MRFSYHTEHQVPYPVEEVFAFFADPDNLPLLMPAWQHARIEKQTLMPPPPRPNSGPEIPAAGVGSHVTLSFRPFPGSPFRLQWKAEIAEFVWNRHFSDVQLSGPFAYWNHCHYVRGVKQAGIDATLIADDVEYEIPFGIIGQLVHRIFLRQQIERTFKYRQGQLSHLLALDAATPQSPAR